jgi:hypothetical protein
VVARSDPKFEQYGKSSESRTDSLDDAGVSVPEVGVGARFAGERTKRDEGGGVLRREPPPLALIVVISREDFGACADPKQFLALVDERIGRLWFDL